MFYSHEVLTSRQYGVATVWLVATLGAKSTLKKVNRKAILEVNVPKACETIMAPDAPMALRLQSNLLYGVVRVYSEQCSYMLVDVENARNNMRNLLNSVKMVELEGKHKAKPDQVNLREDSQFNLDDLFNFDLGNSHDFDLTSSGMSDIDSLLSPRHSVSSWLGSEHDDPSISGINLPPSLSSSQGPGGFSIGGSHRGESMANSRFGSSIFRREEDERIFDPGFAFDEDGNIIDTTAAVPDEVADIEMELPSLRDPTVLMDNYVPDVDMEREHDVMDHYDDDGALPHPNDDEVYPDAEAFTPRQQRSSRHSNEASPPSRSRESTASGSEFEHDVRARPAALVVKAKRALGPDASPELRSADLTSWVSTYLERMAEVTRSKMVSRSNALAKKNANFWVLQNGVGGLATVFGQEEIPEPLRMFTGAALLESLAGSRADIAGGKRVRVSEEEEAQPGVDEEGRRVRERSDEAELGRGNVDVAMDDAGYMADDAGYMDGAVLIGDQTMEVGRQAQTPLADNMSSFMPWNIASSMRGSSVRPGSRNLLSEGGFGTSSISGAPLGGLGGLGGPSSRPGSRLVSATPSRGRLEVTPTAAPTDDHDEPVVDLLAIDFNDEQGDSSQGSDPAEATAALGPTQEYEIFGLAAAMETQEANQPEWIRRTLDREAINFLSFVQASISRAVEREEEDTQASDKARDDEASIAFDTLLPPATNTRIVAAQGLLHVLTLVTKDMLHAEQDAAFGPIDLRPYSI